MKCLIYTLVNFRVEYYTKIFKVFAECLALYSDTSAFELCVITERNTLATIKEILNKDFPTTFYILIPKDKTLDKALLRKFDITEHPRYLEFDKILFLDTDILVQDNIMKLFKAVETLPNKLYVVQEGDLEEKYWYHGAYKPGDIAQLRKENIQSFNSGIFLFKPSETMRNHLRAAKKFGLEYKGSYKFFDQSVFNYYFNMNRISIISPYMTKKMKMYPEENRYYSTKMMLHVANMSLYKVKADMMKRYLDNVIVKFRK
jgi:lipopolysaccharide biosynthesis glycosyltransferase